MVVEFKAVEAIGSLVELLRAADSQAVHCWEQDEAFHPGVFPGLILLARLAADRAGEEFRQATTAAELTRWNANLRGERDHLLQRLTEVTAERDAALKRVAELSGNSGELPAEPAPEPYQWQVGDEVVRNGDVRSVEVVSRGYVKLHGLFSCGAQSDWERAGWKLHRKALPRLTPRHVPLDEDLPDIEPMTPQQVAEFAALTEPIDDSVGADGEGQS